MRGYCLETSDFRDFVLGRIAKITVLDQRSEHTVTDDSKWNAVVKVRIQAHPKLTPGQQDLVRSEYFDGTAVRVHSCRGAMLPYLVQELRLALGQSPRWDLQEPTEARELLKQAGETPP